MSNGGAVGSRGYIFQAIIAIIECLESDNWDEIKVEPETDLDKVDIMLYKDNRIMTAIQVKSSKNTFERSDVKKWLEQLMSDAAEAEHSCLCLVGDSYSQSCQGFIEAHNQEVKIVSFKNLQRICSWKLLEYIKSTEVGGEVRVADLEQIDDSVLGKIMKNCISKYPISKAAFEERIQRVLPVHTIPHCLTPIPTINIMVGLIGRDSIRKAIWQLLERNDKAVLVSGIGGIGKTAVMQYVCNDVKKKGYYVAWIECGNSLREDLLLLRNSLGISKTDNEEQAYEKIKDVLSSRLKDKCYLFLDNMSRRLEKNELNTLFSLGIHVIATSRVKNDYFYNIELEILDRNEAIDMFYKYYGGDCERSYKNTAWDIINSVNSHTLMVELLAKAAWAEGGTLYEFYRLLKEKGFFDVSEEDVWTEHDSREWTIERSVMKLYELSPLSESERKIMRLFTIFTSEKVIYYKVKEWANLDRKSLQKLVQLGWIERGGLETGYMVHQIVKESVARQMKRNNEVVRLTDYGNFFDLVIDMHEYLRGSTPYIFVQERIVFVQDIAEYVIGIVNQIFRSNVKKETINEEERKFLIKAARLLSNLSEVYSRKEDYESALPLCDKAIEIRKVVLGDINTDLAKSYDILGRVYKELGNYEDAEIFFNKALSIRKRLLIVDHPDFAISYNNLAWLYNDIDWRKASQYSHKAWAIDEHCRSKETAKTYSNLATGYLRQGDYDKAIEYYEKAFQIDDRTMLIGHLAIATLYFNMGEVYHAKCDYENAIINYMKAIEIRESLVGPKAVSTTKVYRSLAKAYKTIGDYNRSLECYKNMLDITEKECGVESISTATMYNDMAWLYYYQEDYAKALQFNKKAKNTCMILFGEEHVNTHEIYESIQRLETLIKK